MGLMNPSSTNNRSTYRGAFERSREKIGSILGAETPSGRVTVTLSNYLTLTRLVIVPLFWYGLFSESWGLNVASTLLLAAGAITDLWDGKIARRRGQVTPFGDFMDPLADKFLVLSGFWGILVHEPFGKYWIFVLILVSIISVREIWITLLRVSAIRAGSSIKTSAWGKWKVGVELTTLLATLVAMNIRDYLIDFGFPYNPFIGDLFNGGVLILFFLSTLTALISGWIYLRDYRLARIVI